jgi:hypothetical protein
LLAGMAKRAVRELTLASSKSMRALMMLFSLDDMNIISPQKQLVVQLLP